jgi:retron-type reverse transcriptase
LLIVSKLFEKLLLKRLLPLIEHNKLIPTHQFGFRRRHSTIEQMHRIIHRINDAFEHKAYCSAAFLDISQAFDKVWHTRLLYKLRQSLPLNYFFLLQSYLHNRHFFVKIASTHHTLPPIQAGVPQSSVLEPLLFLMYTVDLPASPTTTIATFADDTAVLATDSDPAVAS